jgi:periplasmic protein TonB
MARIARWGAVCVLALALIVPKETAAQVLSPSQLTEAPQLKSASQARTAIERSYPPGLRDNGVVGKVQLRFTVNADGSVDPASIEVVAASVKALGEAAAKAVAKIEFVPGKKDGTPVASQVVMPISYGGAAQ